MNAIEWIAANQRPVDIPLPVSVRRSIRDSEGWRGRLITNQEVLSYMAEHAGVWFTSKDLTTHFGITAQGLNNHFRILLEKGEIDCKSQGGKRRMYRAKQ